MILLHKIYSICKERSTSLVSILRRSRMVQASLCLALVAITLFYTTIHVFTVDMEHVTKDTIPHYIYIDRDDSPDSVRYKSGIGWRWNVYSTLLKYKTRTGCYLIKPSDKALAVYRSLRNGAQNPIMLTIPSTRTMDRLAQRLSVKLQRDSAEISQALTDSLFCARYGYDTSTIPSAFIPNTYEVYWDMSVDQLMKRMVHEHDAFWNEERRQKASKMNMSPEEVATLASIVDEETANDGEKPMIAGMYINRLNIGMPLQADPTVKFAMGDFALRRIYNQHLQTDNPYNTYKHAGLPPGPICIPSIAGLDAVLNYCRHDYLYMCAKEDFSGSHNFARSYSEHLQNARRYTKALNQRNIH